MRYLLDTYNLLHAGQAMGGPLRGFTVRMLCQYLVAAGVKATLVLDGRAKPDEPSVHEFPQLELMYSGTGVTADTVIGQLVELAEVRKKVTVVSNDGAVVLHARRQFANAMSCETFLGQLTQRASGVGGAGTTDGKVTHNPSPGEIDHWLKEFGFAGEGGMAEERKKKGEEKMPEIDIEDLLGPR